MAEYIGEMEEFEIRKHLEQLHKNSYVWSLRCCNQNKFMAEEALQNVYLKILEGKAVYKQKSTFKTWLFSVIRLTVLDMYRFRKLRFLRTDKYNLESKNSTHLPEVDDKRLDQLRNALAQLPLRQQEVLDLFLYHSMTLDQIAQVLNISIGSVRQHYARGKQRIKKLVTNQTSSNYGRS